MIGLMIGAPGAGKSYELVVFHVLPALRKGYKVITNLPLNVEAFGAIDPAFPDLIELRTTPQLVRGTFDADPQSRGESAMFVVQGEAKDWKRHKGRVFSNVWDYYSEWRHPETGNGPLFIIDECHLAMPRMGTDKDVSEYYSKHRHFNVNLILATQSAPKLDGDIKDMVQNCYRVRKALALGRNDEYIRRVLDGVRGSLIEETVRKYQPQYFKLYKSHTQGNSVEEEAPQDVTPFIVKFRRATWVMLGVGALASVWFIGRAVSDWRSTPEKARAMAAKHALSRTVKARADGLPAWAVDAGAVAVAPRAAASAAVVVDKGPPEPFAQKGVHVVGHFAGSRAGATVNLYFVAVSQNAVPVATYSSQDLERMGYGFRPLTDCAAVIEWAGKLRTITCDLAQQGPAVGAGPSGNTQSSATGGAAPTRGDPLAGGALGGAASSGSGASPQVSVITRSGPSVSALVPVPRPKSSPGAI